MNVFGRNCHFPTWAPLDPPLPPIKPPRRTHSTVTATANYSLNREEKKKKMKKFCPFNILLPILLVALLSAARLVVSKCNNNDFLPERGSTLRVFHVYSQCSPFRPTTPPMSWEDSVLQMQSKDKDRLLFLSSLVAGRSIVPIASGRQILNNPTYIVRVKIGTPAQTLLMALDNSNDVAWVPCTGCLGCSSTSTLFASSKSTTFKNFGCGAAQCQQVRYICIYAFYHTFSFTFWSNNVNTVIVLLIFS